MEDLGLTETNCKSKRADIKSGDDDVHSRLCVCFGATVISIMESFSCFGLCIQYTKSEPFSLYLR